MAAALGQAAVAAIIAWSTVYLERAAASLAEQKAEIQPELLAHLSPLGWEHIGLTGDYTWHENKRVALGQRHAIFPPLPTHPDAALRCEIVRASPWFR